MGEQVVKEMLQVCRFFLSQPKPNFQKAREIVLLNTIGTHEPLVLQQVRL